MKIDLTDTNAGQIAAALVQARRAAGSPAMSMVLTLVVVTDEENCEEALALAVEAGKEHPSRVIGVVRQRGRRPSKVDASIRTGDGAPGESVLLRFEGEVARHADSVVTPLLLPDSPVFVWWPTDAPENPVEDPIGRLGRRRLTDAGTAKRPIAALQKRCTSYSPGDTDLTWTRATPWRALMAAALDQHPCTVLSARIEAERGIASADLIAAWLDSRLGIETEVAVSSGPGITAVRLGTPDGEIAITRPDGLLARYSTPGQPERTVALKRRTRAELLAEELRRLDPDDIYAETIAALHRRLQGRSGRSGRAGAAKRTARGRANGARSGAARSTRARKAGRTTTRTVRR